MPLPANSAAEEIKKSEKTAVLLVQVQIPMEKTHIIQYGLRSDIGIRLNNVLLIHA